MGPRLRLLALIAGALWIGTAGCEELPEYRIKAAFLYNFAAFTEWPADIGPAMSICIVGKDPFGEEIDILQGKRIGDRGIRLQRKAVGESLAGCHVVFIARAAFSSLPRVLESLRGTPALTVADSPEAAGQGVAINMLMVNDRIAFDADLRAARAAGLQLSSKLLRLAHEVRQ